MNLMMERRLLQLAVAAGALVPLLAGGAGVIAGPDMLRGIGAPVPADLDSHFRFLSGLLLGIGAAFLTCVPRIERHSARFQLLGAIILVGGAGRALSLVEIGPPGQDHWLALAMELGVMPLMMLWQWRLAHRWRRSVRP